MPSSILQESDVIDILDEANFNKKINPNNNSDITRKNIDDIINIDKNYLTVNYKHTANRNERRSLTSVDSFEEEEVSSKHINGHHHTTNMTYNHQQHQYINVNGSNLETLATSTNDRFDATVQVCNIKFQNSIKKLI